MTMQYSVGFLEEGADTERQRVILATLPNRYRVGEPSEADVLVVPGGMDAAKWVGAIGPSTRGVFLSSPGRLSSEAFEEISRRAGERPIGLGLAAASALSEPALVDFRVDGPDVPVIVDAVAEVSSRGAGALRAGVFEQLMLLQRLSGNVLRLMLQVATTEQLIYAAEVDSTWRGIRVSARHSFRDRMALHVVSRSRRRELVITSDPHAEPAKVAIFEATGSRSSLPVYQGGFRKSWLSLHDALARGQTTVDELLAARRALDSLSKLY
jgi:hypothetical protein